MKRRLWFAGRFGDPDATHSLRRKRPRAAWRWPAATGIITVATLLGGWMLFDHGSATFGTLPVADEATLLAAPTDALSLWRFSAAPAIVVAIFPSLHVQAMALNRVAAFIERPGSPRNHLLDDTSLAAAMGGTPENFDTYYYGHDYREADLARFFALADRDGTRLTEPERNLRSRLRAAGFFAATTPAALISLPPQGDNLLDPLARKTILHHELAHGAYFTDPIYAAYVKNFWTGLTDPERRAFRLFLGAQGYDPANDDLMRNETQAYLVFTGDPRMFDPSRIGLAEALTLRAAFTARLPLAWLRQETAAP